MTAQIKQSGYSIEYKAGRHIVWRITSDGNKLRQGSFGSEEEAQERIESSQMLMD